MSLQNLAKVVNEKVNLQLLEIGMSLWAETFAMLFIISGRTFMDGSLKVV